MEDLTGFQQELMAELIGIELRTMESMAKHTSFRIGGPAELMAFPKSEQELSQILKAARLHGVTPMILGAGTNVLAPDEGMPGLTVCLKDCLDGMERLEGSRIRCAAGVTMSRAAVFAANQGLSGLEFAHGIPGTMGGGVYMNAGAYGGELKDVVVSARVMDLQGQSRTWSREELDFSYRHSALEERGGIVISVELQLTADEPEKIRERMKDLIARRSASQPLNLPSAGSAFKRPAGGYAAALIDRAGLRGFRVGDAAVSEKHTGFVVNLGQATAAEVRQVLSQVSQRVYESSGIRLEPEVRIW